jgi:hypothetical protein
MTGPTATPDKTGNNVYCNGSSNTITYPAYWFGSTSTGCSSATAGLVQWTGSSVSPNDTLEYCNGTTWTTVNGAAGSVPLSGILAATATNSIDSTNFPQTWAWGSSRPERR